MRELLPGQEWEVPCSLVDEEDLPTTTVRILHPGDVYVMVVHGAFGWHVTLLPRAIFESPRARPLEAR